METWFSADSSCPTCFDHVAYGIFETGANCLFLHIDLGISGSRLSLCPSCFCLEAWVGPCLPQGGLLTGHSVPSAGWKHLGAPPQSCPGPASIPHCSRLILGLGGKRGPSLTWGTTTAHLVRYLGTSSLDLNSQLRFSQQTSVANR